MVLTGIADDPDMVYPHFRHQPLKAVTPLDTGARPSESLVITSTRASGQTQATARRTSPYGSRVDA